MNDHISQENWILFFSGELTLPEKMPILRHCAECSKCRALLDSANDLRFAAVRAVSAPEVGFFPEEQAFHAVAGKAGPKAASEREGHVSFRFEQTENGLIFADEEPAADGFGNRYAMNRTPDGRQFLDDAGALSVQIDRGRLLLRFNDPGVAASAQLITDCDQLDTVLLCAETSILLPADGLHEIVILFREA